MALLDRLEIEVTLIGYNDKLEILRFNAQFLRDACEKLRAWAKSMVVLDVAEVIFANNEVGKVEVEGKGRRKSRQC